MRVWASFCLGEQALILYLLSAATQIQQMSYDILPSGSQYAQKCRRLYKLLTVIQIKTNMGRKKNTMYSFMHVIYLCCLPAPLPIFGIVGEPPHVPVCLDHLRPQYVVLLILTYSNCLQAAVELKGLRAELQHLREKRKVEVENCGGGKIKMEGRRGNKKDKNRKK